MEETEEILKRKIMEDLNDILNTVEISKI